MPQNLEKRNGVWYATVLVPTDVREALGMTRFKKSLGTPNEREAVRLGAPYIASWWAQIKQARGNTSAVVTEAQRWKRALEKAPDEDTRETWALVLSDEVERIAEAKGPVAAKDFRDLAAGLTTPSNQYFETWKAQSTLAADIIGHDKPTMTYGLYSGGADMATKKAALEKIKYPFPKGALK